MRLLPRKAARIVLSIRQEWGLFGEHVDDANSKGAGFLIRKLLQAAEAEVRKQLRPQLLDAGIKREEVDCWLRVQDEDDA